MCRQLHSWIINGKTLWTTFTVLLVLRTSLATGVDLSPCGADGISEIFYDRTASFTCRAEGEVQWRLHTGSTSFLLSRCDKYCNPLDIYGGLLTARFIDFHTSTMTINPVNNTTLYKSSQLLKSSLECTLMNSDNMSARCELHYVYPAEDVVCKTTVTAWSVGVSCEIGNIYSSRGMYKCQLYRQLEKLQQVSLDIVDIVTSPNGKKIGRSEEQMSGVCHFNTMLPVVEGNYSFTVHISPGTQNVSAGKEQVLVVQPRSPTVSCGPLPYVLENSEVDCACNTTSLGQPAGYMVWIIGNQTSQRKIIKEDKHNHEPHRLHHTQTLTLSDHGNTWFRCDVIWGEETFQGNNYTAKVAYTARTPRLSVEGRQNIFNHTVMEKDRVHFKCKSEGRPTPKVHIYNHNNNTEVRNDSSSANYTFIARCEDAATYKCYARNEHFAQSHMAASDPFDLYVRCKPRNISSVDLGAVTFRDEAKKLKFDVMAYPLPHDHAVWSVGRERNNSKDISGKVNDSVMTVTCVAHVQYHHLSSCTLEIFSFPSQPGFYKVQVINELGHQNFTVEIGYGDDYDEAANFQGAAFGGVVAAVIFAVTAVVSIVVIVKKKKRKDSSKIGPILSTNPQNLDCNSGNDDGGQPVQAPIIIYETPWDTGGQPVQAPIIIYETPWDTVTDRALDLKAEMASYPRQSCQVPLYAVVHKTKKTNKKGTNGKEVSDPLRDANAPYAVVDKFRGQTPAQRGKGQRADDDQSPKKRNDHWKKVANPWCIDDGAAHYVNMESLAMHPLSSQREASRIQNGSSPAARRCETNDGRWENGDALIYTLPVFDITSDA